MEIPPISVSIWTEYMKYCAFGNCNWIHFEHLLVFQLWCSVTDLLLSSCRGRNSRCVFWGLLIRQWLWGSFKVLFQRLWAHLHPTLGHPLPRPSLRLPHTQWRHGWNLWRRMCQLHWMWFRKCLLLQWLRTHVHVCLSSHQDGCV